MTAPYPPSPHPLPPLPPGGGVSEDDRTWGVLSHLLTFVSAYVALGVVWPAIVLVAKGRDSAFVRHHAAESVNFQLTMLAAAAVSGLLVVVLVGLPMLVAVGVWYVVQVVRASLAARRGEWFRYPLVLRLV